MSERAAFLDVCPGERRGVVTLDGRPERLWIERSGVEAGPRLGARYRGRVSRISADGRLGFVELGPDGAGALPLKPASRLAQGAVLELEVVAEARQDKLPALKALGPSEGRPDRLAEAPSLEARLAAAAPGASVQGGPAAREAADAAEAAALAIRHDLGGGVSLWLEPTRALTAVDVDWTNQAGSGAGRAMQGNLLAISQAARLLRLKRLGGTVVIDLLGFPGPDPALRAAAREAFAPDGPGVAVFPVSRLGLLQVSKPHGEQPLRELLCGADGALSARSIAQRLVRALAREGAADPGGRLEAACSPEVAAELEPLARELGPRFQVAAQLGMARGTTDIIGR